jgi:diguanylate cyclase (GGDEF)-like protein
MLLILAAGLVLYSDFFGLAGVLAGIASLALVASNVFHIMTRRHIVQDRRFITAVDVVFISTMLFLFHPPRSNSYLVFILLVILMSFWPHFRLLLLATLTVSAYSAYSYFGETSVSTQLVLSSFFVVSIFYTYLSNHLFHDEANRSSSIEQTRLSQVMVEMTHAVSTSLNTEGVLHSIVSRLREVLDAAECSIVRIDPKTKVARMTKASEVEERNIEINLDDHPELQQALAARHLLVFPEAKPHTIIAIPMVVNASVLGLIEVRGPKWMPGANEANTRFFEVMAGAAANALRNAQLFEEVEKRARTDYLTGLANHRFFQATMAVELGRAQRHNRALSVLMIDLDFLKSVNDKYGHPSGDMVIRSTAETIRTTCREIDFAARYGGEEFTVILPETSLAGAVQVADRIRENIAAQQFPGIGTVTASIGVSNYPVNALNKTDLIRVADQALYAAKREGRDRVYYFKDEAILR